MRRYPLFFLVVCVLSSLGWAVPLDGDRVNNSSSTGRSRGCGTRVAAEEIVDNEKSFQRLRSQRSKNSNPIARQTQTFTFDVWWHVVYADNTYEGGSIPDIQIQDQMRVLNGDYAPSGISWKLAGVQRVQNADWFLNTDQADEREFNMKRSLRKGGMDTLNVYTVSFRNTSDADLLGYSYLPQQADAVLDGIVIQYGTLPGGFQRPYNLGRTLTHEVGHWLGLYHTFEGGCSGIGDLVDDTPPQKAATAGCPIFRDTCRSGNLDAISNFMDYSTDVCMDSFSPGQTARMHDQISFFRSGKQTS